MAESSMKAHVSPSTSGVDGNSNLAVGNCNSTAQMTASKQQTIQIKSTTAFVLITALKAPTIVKTAPDVPAEADRPTLTRKRSRLLPFSKSDSAATSDQDDDGQHHAAPTKANASSDKKAKKKNFLGLRPQRDGLSDLSQLAGARLESQRSSTNASQERMPLAERRSLPASNGNRAPSRENVDADEEPRSSISGRPSGSFTWLSKKNKNNRKSLFPMLGDKPQKSHTAPPTAAASPRPSTSARNSDGLPRPNAQSRTSSQRNLRINPNDQAVSTAPHSANSISFAPHPALLRTSSTKSIRSNQSSPTLIPAAESQLRTRSSTLGSVSGGSDDNPPTPPFVSDVSGRTSTSTAGRSSFSTMFGLNRFRHNDPSSPRQGSTNNTATGSLTNSMVLNKEPSLPPREEGETAIHYLDRVEDITPRSQIPSVLSKSGDEFLNNVMRSFMRKFAYFGDPLDMAIRKLLMEVDLPKETQQIDRVLQSFADRYHECNPGIFTSSGEAYFIAFSILMLQTDFFNKNNKRKMTKQDYVKNSSIEGISEDVLECFYDNIIYTPFIRVEDDQDVVTMRTRRANRKTAKAAKAAKAAIKNVPSESGRRDPKQPLDPYTLIFESRLDTLRPPLKDLLTLEDSYSYLGSLPIFDRRVLRNSKIGIIQIESARSRPDAFMSPSGIENPAEARVGLVDLPIDKVGVLWRKDPKKKTARSPWQEWGAVLTGAGLYFFKNSGWVKNYAHQFENHVKHGGAGTLCFFKPPISSFKPDYMLPTDHGVALQDATYKRHKNAFTFFGHNGSEEVFLADRDTELNDWLAKLNHQAACKTAGIRPRGLIGGQYDGQRQRGLRRLESSSSGAHTQTVQTSTGEVTIQRGTIDQNLAQQISAARKVSVEDKLKDGQTKLDEATKRLDDQLRDSRHLLILAPIQQRTCEQLVQAAIRAQDKLKTLRIEHWKLTCHQDILTLDLEEEQREAERWHARIGLLSPKPGLSPGNTEVGDGLQRIPSDTSVNSAAATAEAPADATKRVSVVEDPDAAGEKKDSEAYHTPPETPPQTPNIAAQSPQGSVLTSQDKSPITHSHRMSTLSSISNTSHVQPRGPRPSLDIPIATGNQPEIMTGATDEEKSETSEAVEDAPAAEDESRPKTSNSTDNGRLPAHDRRPSSSGGTPDRGRVRRVSIQRVIKEGSEGRLHKRHSSRKHGSKDETTPPGTDGSPLSAGGSLHSAMSQRSKADKKAEEESAGLVRSRPSFTVHGKKASVVHIGGEWTTNPEETLQRMKAAATPMTPTNPAKEIEIGSLSLKSPLSKVTSADEEAVDGDNDAETPRAGSPLVSNGDSLQTRPSAITPIHEEKAGSSDRSQSITAIGAQRPGTATESESSESRRETVA